MSTGVVPPRAVPRLRLRLNWIRPHRGWWLTAAAGVAWVALVAWSVAAASPGHHGGAGHADHAMAHPAVGEPVGVGSWMGHWLLMVVAMMWPLYAASTAALARTTFRRWRVAAVLAHVGAITGLWMAFGLVGRGAYLLVDDFVPAWAWSAAWLVVAVAATWSMWRARLLRT